MGDYYKKQLPVFLPGSHHCHDWPLHLAGLLYAIGVYSGKNPFDVIKDYGPAYITAVGTMSSAATLLPCAAPSHSRR